MLLAENLSCLRSDRLVLDALDLRVAPREIVALLGQADAGKTTALECLLGVHPPASGRASINDLDATACAKVASSLVAYVPAQLSLPLRAQVLAHVRDTCRHEGRRLPEPFLCGILQRAGIPASLHGARLGDCAPPIHRKLAITLAGLKKVPALLLDEPMRDLSAADLESLIAMLRLLRKRGAAILLATRDLAFAHRLATRVVVLERGCTIESYDPNASRRSHHDSSYLTELVG